MANSRQIILSILADSGKEIYALLLRLSLRQDVADDLMQELFIRLCNVKSSKINRAYAFKTAVNLFFDHHRKVKRGAIQLESDFDIQAIQNTPLNAMVNSEMHKAIINAISKLPESQKSVCILRYIQQQPYSTIAKTTGNSPHHVRAMCSRAIAKLRKKLRRSQDYAE